ncbi:MAG: YsnF/AvaK domain-containing protein [Ktedonobacterales bacterium]
MSSYAGVLPGARVRGEGGFIGTVERLEHHWAGPEERPDRMIVRSDDRRWRYSIPLMFVSSVTQGALYPMVQIKLDPSDLAHYIVQEVKQPSQPRAAVAAATAAHQPEAELPALRVPVLVEELVARKHPVPLGMAFIHKGVELADESLDVPVYHEEAVIERIPADQYDGHASTNPNEVIVPVIEERLVVHKERVVTEYIRVRKELVAEQQHVTGQVRREYVTVKRDSEGDAPEQTLFDSRPGGAWMEAPRDEPPAVDGATTPAAG